MFRPRGKFGIDRNHAQLLLPLQGFLSHLVPTLVKLAFVLGHVFRRRLVGGMGGTGGKVGEKRAIRCRGFRLVDPGDGFVGQIVGEVVAVFGQG